MRDRGSPLTLLKHLTRGVSDRTRTIETLDQARREIATYIHSYYHRPHVGLRHRTPTEVRQTWEDGQRLAKAAV